jgi:hypothetical protein
VRCEPDRGREIGKRDFDGLGGLSGHGTKVTAGRGKLKMSEVKKRSTCCHVVMWVGTNLSCRIDLSIQVVGTHAPSKPSSQLPPPSLPFPPFCLGQPTFRLQPPGSSVHTSKISLTIYKMARDVPLYPVWRPMLITPLTAGADRARPWRYSPGASFALLPSTPTRSH